MATFDFTPYRPLAIDVCRRAFLAFRAARPGESFYAMGIYTVGLFHYFIPTAMTEECLDALVERYRRIPDFAQVPLEELRPWLKWQACDSPILEEGQPFGHELDGLASHVSKTLIAIDTEHGREEFTAFALQIEDAMVDILSTLDREGLFGAGAERDEIYVGMFLGDQDDSILRVGRRLNPASTVARFEREWRCDGG